MFMISILASAVLAAPSTTTSATATSPPPTTSTTSTPMTTTLAPSAPGKPAAPAVTGTQILPKPGMDSKLPCPTEPNPGTPGVSVKLDSKFTGKEYKVRVTGGADQTMKPGDTITLPSPKDTETASVSIVDEADKLICEIKDIKIPEAAAEPEGPKPAAEPYDPEIGELVAEARTWLAVKHPMHDKAGSGNRRKITIYHTPDGRPAYPVPHDVEETDEIYLVVAVPKAGDARLTARTCPKLKLGRVRGSWTEATEAVGGFSSGGDKGRIDPVEWELISVGEFRCSEQLDYTIETHLPVVVDGKAKLLTATHAETITLDPVYFFTVGVALAFDVGRPTNVSLLERPTMGMTGSEKYVASVRDFSGLKPLITVGAHPCGANPKRWRPCDMFTPTLAFDPTRLNKGVGFGINFSFTPWFGVLLAMNIYKSTVLQQDSKIEVGDVWTTAGDLPTKEVFNAQSVGAFVGINLTSDIIQAIRGKAKQ